MNIKGKVILVILIAVIGSGFFYFTFNGSQDSEETEDVIASAITIGPHGETTESIKAAEGTKIDHIDLLKKKKSSEIFYVKAKAVWDEKMSHFIISELKMGQDVYYKYKEIQIDFNENEKILLDGPYDNIAYEKRFEAFSENVRNILVKSGFDIKQEKANPSKDLKPIFRFMAQAIDEDKKKFLEEHLAEIKTLIGSDNFKKYEKIKTEFNREITKKANRTTSKFKI